jgi:hypothetical protein
MTPSGQGSVGKVAPSCLQYRTWELIWGWIRAPLHLQESCLALGWEAAIFSHMPLSIRSCSPFSKLIWFVCVCVCAELISRG